MDNIQQIFFQQIKNNLPAHLSLVDEIASLLNISNDSAYRRIRNEKPISFDEIKILCAHFNVSVDQLLNLKNGSANFYADYITPDNFDFKVYMEKSYKHLAHIGSFPQSEIFYYCKDFPLFYYYAFPELAAFKYFIWMKTSLNFPAFSNVPFSFDYYMKPFIEMGDKVFRAYAAIPGTEIMNVENVVTMLLQIEYYKKSFLFSSDDIVNTLLDKFDEMIRHIRRQADQGVKFIPNEKPTANSPKYQLYVNDFVIGDNSVVGKYDNQCISFLTHSHINFIAISDPNFTAYHYNFIKNIIKKSILISDTGEKHRARFFHLIHDKIQQCRDNKLETMG